MTEAIYLVNGARTPIGSFMGALSTVTAPQLGAITLQEALSRSKCSADAIEHGFMGCVLTAGQGQAPARQALIGAGLPKSVGAITINKVCGSGLQAIINARASILAGDAQLILAGGMESMSNTPHLMKDSRKGYRLGNQALVDSMVHDGLWDPYGQLHMGSCAEQCAQKYGFSQAQQDEYAILSYQRSLASIQQGLFKPEISPVSIASKKETLTVDTDEEPGKGNIEKLPQLRPVFEKEGTITAGNASTLNDGAAAVLVASENAIKTHNLKPMARIVSIGHHAQEPVWFTTAPVGAIQQALKNANLTQDDIDVYEINEAFAVVTLAAIRELALDINKVNPRGGAISLGHPIGASGTRLLVTLMHTLAQNKQRYGLATLCIGGGEGVAVIIENLQR